MMPGFLIRWLILTAILAVVSSFSAYGDWTAMVYRDGSAVHGLADADRLISTTAPIATSLISETDMLGFSTGEGIGHFSDNYAVPGIPQNSATDNYAVRVTGNLSVTEPNIYTFGLNTDDGARLRIDGQDVIVDDVRAPPHDSPYASLTLQAGLHIIEWTWFNTAGGVNGGGAEGEAFWASGSYSSFNNNFALLKEANFIQNSPSIPGLVAYYGLNGDAKDASGNGLDGQITGTSFALGFVGLGLNNNGDPNSFIEVPSSALFNINAVTISLWIRSTSFAGGNDECLVYKANRITTHAATADRQFVMWVAPNGAIELDSTPQGATSQTICVSPQGSVQTGKFSHIVGIVDATAKVMKVYVNGVLMQSVTYPGDTIQTGDFPMRLAGPFLSSSDQAGLNGLLDEVRIYDRALSSDEVSRLYSAANGTDTWPITAQPLPKTYGNLPTKQNGKDSIVVITHGWQTLLLPPDVSWVDGMSNAVQEYFNNHAMNNWQVHGYKWVNNAWKFHSQDALNNGIQEGTVLGNTLASQGWAHVHLIGHSAGAALIQAASERIKAVPSSTVVHCTFLDAFVGTDQKGVSSYGKGADWADSYFARDSLTGGEAWPLTEGPLDHAYNVDVTQLTPTTFNITEFRSSPNGNTVSCTRKATSHSWPHDFYQNTITGNVTGDYAGFGFPLSEEAGNWSFALNNYVPGNSPSQILGDYVCTPLGFQLNQSGQTGLDFTKLKTIFSDTGVVVPSVGSIQLQTDSPAWLATSIPVPSSVNSVSFDAMFTSSNGAAGLLTVYWDTNMVGSVDEQAVVPGLQHYSFGFPEAPANTVHVLGFRLDPFTNVQSTAIVTNVWVGGVGIKRPFSLAVTTNTVNNALVYQLNSDPGGEYQVQASSDLLTWTTIALLANTNGLVPFFDTGATNAYRFYRAVTPY